MNTETFDYNSIEVEVEYRPRIAFMYSRCPITLYNPSKTIGGFGLRVTNTATNESFLENRRFYNGFLTFELGAIMRHLAPDVTTVLNLEQRDFLGAYASFKVAIEVNDDVYWSTNIKGIYGALNANESFRYVAPDNETPEPRRLWVNYPQTFRLFADANDIHAFVIPLNKFIYTPNDNQDVFALEESLIDTLYFNSKHGSSEATAILSSLRKGNPQIIGLTNNIAINALGQSSSSTGPYWLKLQPDLTPAFAPGRTYLRWLQRDGSVGYWLFHSGEMQTAVSQDASFQRYYENPNRPSYTGRIAPLFENNPRQADFKESRTLNLGTTVNNLEEYEYLVGLLTSPVVDRYVMSGEGAGWERVNILPSTQSYSHKRGTPHTQLLEFTIQLPDRDTIKL